MKLNQAEIEDYNSIIAFYDDVTDRTPEIATYARWSKRKHPTLEGIKAYIEEGSMYLYKEEKVIVGAVAVTMYQGEDYHAIEWSQQVADDKEKCGFYDTGDINWCSHLYHGDDQPVKIMRLDRIKNIQ